MKYLAGLLPMFFFMACNSPKEPLEEHSAAYSLKDLKVYDGLEVTLFASEPMFSNPTNIDVDARGRVWVCEAYNYRNQFNPENPVREAGDRIVILEDTDGDGKADSTKVFYQGEDINSALGIAVLGDKIFVSRSPYVFVFTDSNGDDIPEKKEILFQKIGGEQDDHGIHAFTFGYDGRLYFNMGNASKVLVSANGDTVVDVHGRKVFCNGRPFRDGLALRCNLDGSHVEVLGHNFRNNYELTTDQMGTVWQSDNDDDGNKATRINYVMEFGNYGYKDELTGAGWNSRPTNMEREIPLRHWHLNDPGVVPNLLQTGAGSPAGITLYEGELLPNIFTGHLIHAEPGTNVVRAYPVEKSGAGFKATTINIIEGQKDQWFRPVDVCVAPDGSLFVGDWYDPGVGGHQVGDLDRGRIYRVAPKGSRYKKPTAEIISNATAIEAWLSPNQATRFLGYNFLKRAGVNAEKELLGIWENAPARRKAQALWLLAQLPDGKKYIDQAIQHEDEDIRITGIRCARHHNYDVLRIAKQLQKDPSPQVRREVSLALFNLNNVEAANIWAELASQHDGNDRWYLEALGIASTGKEDLCYDAWMAKIQKNWDTPEGRDIIWRLRSSKCIPQLSAIIKSADDQQMGRYFRALDFHTSPVKENELVKLIDQVSGEKLLLVLKHMNYRGNNPRVLRAVASVMEEYKNKLEFVELAAAFRLKNKSNELLDMALNYPDSVFGREAAKVLVDWQQLPLIERTFDKGPEEVSLAIISALRPLMGDRRVLAFMENIVTDTTRKLEIRKAATQSFLGPWGAEDRLLQLVKDNAIPEDLHFTCAGVFQYAWRETLRKEAAPFLKVPAPKGAASLASISSLEKMTGDSVKGKLVFKQMCANCHRVRNEGVGFGPDLSEIGDKLSPEALYTSIIYPDQGIGFGYEGWKLELMDGSVVTGKILSETADKIDIQFMSNINTVNPGSVRSRVKLVTSMMPSGLQASMTEQDLIDVVEYLKTLKKKEQQAAAP